MRSINPATGEVIREYAGHTPADVERLLVRAEASFASWRRTSFGDRAALMRRAAAVLRRGVAEYARVMALEMGKPIVAAEAEVEKCAGTCEFFAEKAEHFLAQDFVVTDASRSYIRYDPIGPILAVMPWNFPFWQVFRFAAPGLMAGNVGLLKHAANVPGCALAIEDVFRKAGFPEGVFTTLLVTSPAIEGIIRHTVVRAVTLTGSEPAGVAVASQAGSVLKKTVLELGGSDPFIVLADADPVTTAASAAKARCINSGQSCIAAKRFIVEEPIAEAFEGAMVAAMAALKIGDPLDRSTDVGPMAREDLLGELHSQLERSIKSGARLLTGGQRMDRKGYFYAPTVLAGVEPGMAAFDEETFGPVAAIVRARDASHAVELANRTSFGLGASIWTSNAKRAESLVPDIEAGCVFINGIVKSDPRLPFGGVKRSGYGRELAAAGIREFVNIKTVWMSS